MRQEELLAYIDRQEEAKFRVSLRFKFCVPYNFFPIPLLLSENCVYICVPQKKSCWWKGCSCTGGSLVVMLSLHFIHMLCILERELGGLPKPERFLNELIYSKFFFGSLWAFCVFSSVKVMYFFQSSKLSIISWIREAASFASRSVVLYQKLLDLDRIMEWYRQHLGFRRVF